MDAQRFDRFAKSLGGMVSRRSALAALLGTGLAGVKGDAAAKDKKGRHRKGKDAGKRRGQRKPKSSPAGDAVAAEAADCLSPGPSSNMNGCNFNGRDFAFANLSSSSMRKTRFRGASLCGADLSSSQLKQATFRGLSAANKTDLTRADFRSSGCNGTVFGPDTVLCGTRMCNGAIRNDHCPAGADPAFACCADGGCETGRTCVSGVCCDVCDDGCEFDSLTDAVAAAQDGDTIRLCPGRFQTQDLEIAKDLTIVGAGQGADPATDTVLDGQGDGPVLVIFPGADVVLWDVRVTGGNSGGTPGGGIRNVGTLRLVGVSVVGNTTSAFGGGIGNGGTLTLGNGSRVENNTASAGGGIRNEFGGTLTLEAGSRVEGNTTSGFDGGGIFSEGTLTLESGSRVEGNDATLSGGGIFSRIGTATLEAGSVVTGNTAGTEGGGVREFDGTVNVADATIVTGNSPDNCRPVGAVPNCVN